MGRRGMANLTFPDINGQPDRRPQAASPLPEKCHARQKKGRMKRPFFVSL